MAKLIFGKLNGLGITNRLLFKDYGIDELYGFGTNHVFSSFEPWGSIKGLVIN